MTRANKTVSNHLAPINIKKGNKNALTDFLHNMCQAGFFNETYEKVCGHFVFDCQRLLSGVPQSGTIEWGNIKSKSEILRFCYFLRDSGLIEQKLASVWVHFSYNGEQFPVNSYSLAAASNQHYPEPYKLAKDTGLQAILREYYDAVGTNYSE
jgi:hypothetical protein